jgi:hypothetical protein
MVNFKIVATKEKRGVYFTAVPHHSGKKIKRFFGQNI